MIRILIAALAIACVALAYSCWDVWSQPVDTSAIVPDLGSTNARLATDALAAKILPSLPAGDLSQTVDRPLFTQTRRPLVKKETAEVANPADEVAPTAQSEQLVLVGVMHQGQGTARALIRNAPHALGSWVLVGESIGGWSLKSISQDSAIVENGGHQIELHVAYLDGLSENKPAQATP